MIVEIKIPSPGESITEVEISQWFVQNGDYVEKDQELGEIESDKATLPLIAEESGTISILIEAGTSAQVGSVACKIDTSASAPKEKSKKEKTPESQPAEKETAKAPEQRSPEKEKPSKETQDEKKEFPDVKVSPVAKEMMKEHGVSVEDIISGLRRIGKREVELALNTKAQGSSRLMEKPDITRDVARNKMSSLRKKISERLVSVKNETAMLTTFNEVDMSAVMEMRKKYQNQFVEKHGIKLGYMSFFTRAATEALKLHPMVNSYLENDEIVTPLYFDIGIAVQTDKGLMVPVIRNTETMTLADIERNIAELAEKARKNRISLDDLSGGSFTITNGGVFGSLLSTPILNPPQSGILGMHNIVDRPVAINGKVEIRPMMYIALSYDHRVIDGRDSVGFLVKVKEFIENPLKMLTGGNDPMALLLDI